MKNNITIEKTEANPDTIEFVYLIDGVYNQQKGFKTEEEAMNAAKEKVKQMKSYKRK